MPVTIKIKGNSNTNEFEDALALKEIFESEFRNNSINGEILIISNATLFGQEVKDVDLIAIGSFENYRIDIRSKAKVSIPDGLRETRELEKEDYNLKTFKSGRKFWRKTLKQEMRSIYVNDFCFVFETKRHRAEDIQLNGLNLLVRYNSKLSDVTTQSENQKYSLANYFEDRINFSPYICNFIWLRNLRWNSLKNLIGENSKIYDKHNYLPDNFSVKFLFQLASIQSIPYNPFYKDSGLLKNSAGFSSLNYNQSYDLNEIATIFDLFKRIKNGSGELTRTKIEKITSQILNDQQYVKAIGEKLIIISGRAGTGKTIKLLRIACDLAIQHSARSLILTFNHALVSDIKRSLALAEIPDGVDNQTVNISTLHKFFYEILIGFELGECVRESKNGKKYIPDFIDNYTNHLNTLNEYLDLQLIGDKEIAELMSTRHEQVGWDYLLIDEAQDWGELEKEIIFRIFGREKVIIADGVDQLIRSQNKCNWIRGLKLDVDFKKTHEKKGLRQKVNLVSFVNKFAEKLNINWKLEAKKELTGGKIIISTNGYSPILHKREFELCTKNGNSAYEMMFLVPPSLVERVWKTDEFGNQKQDKSFSKIEEYKANNIHFWDGTSTDLRTEYVVDLNEHRLLQYESCRGLEGWTTVNLDFDKFIDYKKETFKEEKDNYELALESFDEKRRKFVYLWALIPLTRAIDTLIITLSNPDNEVSKILYEVYKENPDFIEWIE
ncbi:AAA family ATPase [Zunongwangia sp.]|uniref:AAA family ATPase n=1 Tax=Zunongwangia sp. TaxID=1965325 RepID=UPI003AA7DF41